MYAIHRNPKYWENPDEFDPERFLKGKKGSETFLYMPFSKGSRMCIGINFAMMEIKALLSRLLLSFEFYCDPSDLPFRPSLAAVSTVDPLCPLRFRLRSRP